MKMVTEREINLIKIRNDQVKKEYFARDIKKGLSTEQKYIPSVYFYDKKGSILFEEICDLVEYYQTRTEASILREYSKKIAEDLPSNVDIIELGSGSSVKTKILLEAFLNKNKKVRYFPIDISGKFLLETAHKLIDSYSNIDIKPIAGQYENGLKYIYKTYPNSQKTILWLGSSIGNMDTDESLSFMKHAYRLFSKKDKMFIGMDLKKDIDVLERAYNDAKGVTAEFNLNLLNRINSELGGEFKINNFSHRAIYNNNNSRIEMHLVCTNTHKVKINDLDMIVKFNKGEYIHTENSHKYSIKDIDKLASDSGFKVRSQMLDKNNLFSLNEFIKK